VEQQESIFREKSVDRVSSPEQLDKYIKTTTPSVWIIFFAIIILLAGVIVWATVGNLKTYSEVGIKVSNNEAIVFIKEADYEKICDESYVELEGAEYEILKVEGPVEAVKGTDSYMLHASSISEGEWYYIVYAKVNLKDGQYKGKVVYELTSPISFVIN